MSNNAALPALSVPAAFVLPRSLRSEELLTLRAVADILVPACGESPCATSEHGFDSALVTAVTARADAFAGITAILARWEGVDGAELERRLRVLHDQEPETFQALSAVVAGAWLILPAVRERIGYPGQHRNPAPLDQAVDELSNGLLDSVIERGSIYRTTSVQLS